MNKLNLEQASKILNGHYEGSNVSFDTVSTDTRSVQSGQLFIAIKGPNFDGHAFVAEAKNKGAIAAMVSEKIAVDFPLLVVSDTRLALGALAAYQRKNAHIPLIGVTGSNGKTTTKAMMAAILNPQGETLVNQGTLNNDFGAPLTILKQTPSHRFGVIEMGANHVGEIAYLANIVQPDVGVITNVGPAHLEGFGDVQGVAREKSAIYAGLSEQGTAIVNTDDKFANYFREVIGKRKIISFGIKNSADVIAKDIQLATDNKFSFTLSYQDKEIKIQLPTLGHHNIYNALAAAAATLAIGASLENIKKGLETMEPVAKRLIVYSGLKGARIIDDSYNAIPNAVQAALEVLTQYPGEHLFAFGGMAELGKEAEACHIELGKQARALGIKHLYAIGPISHLTVEAFGAGGKYFTTKQELIDSVKNELHSTLTVLVKGSRGARMEDVVAAIKEG